MSHENGSLDTSATPPTGLGTDVATHRVEPVKKSSLLDRLYRMFEVRRTELVSPEIRRIINDPDQAQVVGDAVRSSRNGGDGRIVLK